MSIVVLWACVPILVAALLLALWAIAKGPTSMERSISLDVMTSCLIGMMVVVLTSRGRTDVLSILVVLAAVGFVGTTAIARFARHRSHDKRSNELTASHTRAAEAVRTRQAEKKPAVENELEPRGISQ